MTMLKNIFSLNFPIIILLFVSTPANSTIIDDMNLAIRMEERNRFSDALFYYRRILNDEKASTDIKGKAQFEIAEILDVKLNELELAKQEYQKLLDNFPASPLCDRAKIALANIHNFLGNREIAIEHIRSIEDISNLTLDELEVLNKIESGAAKTEKLFFSELILNEKIKVLILKPPKGIRIKAHSNNQSHQKNARLSISTERGIKYPWRHNVVVSPWKDTIKIKDIGYIKGKVRIKPSVGALISINGKRYRGELELVLSSNGKLEVINILDVEDYLKGVVPMEIGCKWSIEALKAQAVVSRTFAYYTMFHKMLKEIRGLAERKYDVYATIYSQVYGGVNVEAKRCDKAVMDTKGLILALNSKPIKSLFHAHNAGESENPIFVWGLPYPGLRIGEDSFSKQVPHSNPRYHWSANFTKREIASKLGKILPISECMKSIEVQRRMNGNRITTIIIKGPDGEMALNSNTFRLLLGSTKIKSTLFEILDTGDSIEFTGYGYGHGVGMSQWGAYQMALQDKSYKDILLYYFPGAEIKRIDLLN